MVVTRIQRAYGAPGAFFVTGDAAQCLSRWQGDVGL